MGCACSILITLHSDLYHFCNWIKYELLSLIEHRCIDCIANHDTKQSMKALIQQSIHLSLVPLETMRDDILNNVIVARIMKECNLSLIRVDEVADSWQANIQNIDNAADNNLRQQSVSEYVPKIFKPLQNFLIFLSNHSLEHIQIKEKNLLIWNLLNRVCCEYWLKIAKVQERTAQIRKIMERRRKRRTQNENSNDESEQKTGAQRVEYQLFLDVRQFMQQIQGFIGGLQRDQKILNEEREKKEQEKDEKSRKSSSIIVSIKKKKKKKTMQEEEEVLFVTDNLENWTDFNELTIKYMNLHQN